MNGIEIVNLDASMAADLEGIERICFPTVNPEELLTADDIRAYAQVFPEGYFVAMVDGSPVGMAAGILLDFDLETPQHSMAEITGEHQCGNHDPEGAWFYGTDISVHPDYRGRGIGGMLYEKRKTLVMDANKRGIVAGGSIPGFFDHKSRMSAAEYVAAVVAGEIHDATLSFQLSHGFEVRGLIEDYMDDDAEDGWATLIVWENPDYTDS